VVATKGIVDVIAGKIILNSITRVTFGESVVRIRSFNENSINDGNLKWGWTVGNNTFITLTVVSLDYGTKCEKVPFIVFTLSVIFNAFIFDVLNIMPRWRDNGTRPMRLIR